MQTLSSFVAPQAAHVKTCGALSDNKSGIMMNICFQWLGFN